MIDNIEYIIWDLKETWYELSNRVISSESTKILLSILENNQI